MSAQHWHKRYHSDALTGFMSLSLEERGAYQTVLDMIYDRGGPIVDNDRLLAGYMGVSLRKWTSLRDSLVAKGKITRADGHISNDRAISEIEKAAKTSRKHAENGSKGGYKSGEIRKKGNENNGGDEAGLEAGSSLSRYQIPEAAKAASARDEQVNALAHEITAGTPLSSPEPGRIAEQQSLVRGWIEAGADPDTIRKIVRERLAATSSAPRTLRWFDGAVRDAIIAKQTASTSPEAAAALRMAEGILRKRDAA